MDSILKTVELFVYGFIVGYLWYPIWRIMKRIWQEAKSVKEEWRKPNG